MGQHSMYTWKQISTDRNLTKHGPCAQNQICTGLARTVLLIRIWEVLLPKIIQNDTDHNYSARTVLEKINAHGSVARTVLLTRAWVTLLPKSIKNNTDRNQNLHGACSGNLTHTGLLHGPCWSENTVCRISGKIWQLSFERWSPINQLQQLYFWGFVYINSSHNLKWMWSTPITHSKHLTFICDQIHLIQYFCINSCEEFGEC